MIKKLRIKIIATIMSIVSLVVLLFSCGVAIYLSNKTERELFSSMEMSINQTNKPQNDENLGNKIEIGKQEPQNFIRTEICIVSFNRSTGEINTISENSYISDEILESAVQLAIGENKSHGEIKSLNLIFVVENSPEGNKIAFADLKFLKNEISQIWILTICIDIVFLIIMFGVSFCLSKIIVKPVEKSIDDQKRFIADASHELKTPLTVILANNKILMNEKDVSQNQMKWLESSNEEIKLASSIINDMLTLAKSENLTEIKKDNINISKIASKICLQFDTVAFDKKVKLNYNISENLTINADEKMMKQLFMILIDNGLKYEPMGGEVCVNLFKDNSKIIFEVKNKNSLISPEDLPHIFDRFYRADKSRSSSGVGLGLSIAKNFVSLNGGEISAISNKDMGTIFKVVF